MIAAEEFDHFRRHVLAVRQRWPEHRDYRSDIIPLTRTDPRMPTTPKEPEEQ